MRIFKRSTIIKTYQRTLSHTQIEPDISRSALCVCVNIILFHFAFVRSVLFLLYSTLFVLSPATAIISRESSRNTFIIPKNYTFCVPLSSPASLARLPIYVPTSRSTLIPAPVSVCVFVSLSACTVLHNLFLLLLTCRYTSTFVHCHSLLCNCTPPHIIPIPPISSFRTFSQLLLIHASTTSLTFAHISPFTYPTYPTVWGPLQLVFLFSSRSHSIASVTISESNFVRTSS